MRAARQLFLAVVVLCALLPVAWDGTAFSASLAGAKSVVTRPEPPRVHGGPRYTYIEWPANPEFDLAGYNVFCQAVTSEDDLTPVGEARKVNTAGLITKSECIDKGVGKGNFYVYSVQAVGADGSLSELSGSSSPPVNGQRLRVFIPDVYANQAGIYGFQEPGDDSFRLAIPIATQCAYDVSTFGIQVAVHVPSSLIDDVDELAVFPSGIAAGFVYTYWASLIDDDTVEIRIAAAGLTGLPLYGVGTLFYVVVTPSDSLLAGGAACGSFSFERDILPQQPGVRLYDGILKPISLDLRDGQLCGDGLCAAHGDANLDGSISDEDATRILEIASGAIAEPSPCSLRVADVNADGTVDQADAILLLRHLRARELWPSSLATSVEASPSSFSSVAPDKAEGEGPLVRIGDVTAEPGAEVDVPVYIENAPQTAGCSFDIAFPSGTPGLTLRSVTLAPELQSAGFLLASHSGYTASTPPSGHVRIVIAAPDAFAKSGTTVAVILKFLVDEAKTDSVTVRLSDTTVTDPYGFTPRYDAPSAPKSASGSVQIGSMVCGSVAVDVYDESTEAAITTASISANPGPSAPLTQNTNGLYTFSCLNAGACSLTIEAPGYARETRNITVPSGDVLAVSVGLHKPSTGGCTSGSLEDQTAPSRDALPDLALLVCVLVLLACATLVGRHTSRPRII